MTPSRILRLALLIALGVAVVMFARQCGTPQSGADTAPQTGGKLVASYLSLIHISEPTRPY